MRINSLLILCAFLLMGCAENTDHTASTKKGSESPEQQELNLTVTHSFVTDTNEHYRGLEIHDKVAVIGGSQGNILVYDFKLDSLRIFFTAEGIHIRDIDKISDGSHTALGITQPAQILFRDMPSDSFIVVFEGKDSLMFLDGIDFWENEYGIAFGDPIDGYPLVLFRELYDKTWSRVKEVDFPKEASNYAGFAASGTSIKCLPNGVAIIGLGNETAKVLRTPDYGMTWDLIDVPFHKEPNGTGIYSMAFKDSLNGVAVGGHWQNVTCDSSKIYTTDGGLSWHLSEGVQEYRSCVTYYKDDVYISTGTTGTDISYDGGKSWQLLDTIGYNAIAFQKDGTGIAVGSYGRITLLELK